MAQEIPLYQVDAFSDAVFSGNPAAVCPLEAWLPDELLQAIAAENNLAETAFFVPEGRALSSALVHADPRSGPLRPRHPRQRPRLEDPIAPGGAGSCSFQTRSGLLTVHCGEAGLCHGLSGHPGRRRHRS